MCCIQLTSSSATNIALVSLLPRLCPGPVSLGVLKSLPLHPSFPRFPPGLSLGPAALPLPPELSPRLSHGTAPLQPAPALLPQLLLNKGQGRKASRVFLCENESVRTAADTKSPYKAPAGNSAPRLKQTWASNSPVRHQPPGHRGLAPKRQEATPSSITASCSTT